MEPNTQAQGAADGATAPPDADALARAVLASCADGCDALMYAALKGYGDAVALCTDLVHALLGDADSGGLPPAGALQPLDDHFAAGLARWGKRLTAQGLKAFHRAVCRWRSRFVARPFSLDEQSIWAWATQGGEWWIAAPSCPQWPSQLDDLAVRADWAPPLCLWGVGRPEALASCPAPIAIVGSRAVTPEARAVGRQLACNAAMEGHLVVSGGAIGADASAHQGALDAYGCAGPSRAGRTVAVFAGGLDTRGPASNAKTFDAIVEASGALISEMTPGTPPEPRRFLLRNRLIAALASTIVVVQARRRSGALNTAAWAGEMGRDVLACAGGALNADFSGCNALIADGKARLLASVDDIEAICHAAHAPGLPAITTQDAPNPATDPVYAAIASCRRRSVPATPGAVLGECRRMGLDGAPQTLSDLFARAGELEMAGLIGYEAGQYRTHGTAG